MTFSSWLPLGVFDPVAAFFELVAFVDEQRHVAAVIDDELRAFAVRERDRLVRCTTNILRGVSPFQAKTGMPAFAMAAAAWSWVEKMLQLAQRTSAPSSTSVSISTAVWIVMCNEPVMRTPCERFAGGVFLADRHQAGHFLLGDVDFLAAPIGEADVGDFVVVSLGFGDGVWCS